MFTTYQPRVSTFTLYVRPGLMVYNIYGPVTLWINGLQRVDIMDEYVELYLYMVILMVPVDE